MVFKEVKMLREAGKLDEALKIVNEALKTAPYNIWNKRAAAWVYYDFLKKYAQPENFEAFKKFLIRIKDLQLEEEEKMLFDSSAWQIGSMVFSLQKLQSVDYQKIDEIFNIIQCFHFSKPSRAYSYIYKAFHKGYKQWSRYLDFADWWNFNHFLPEDYSEQEFNGEEVMSIVEQAYIAYSKKLLEGELSNASGRERVINKQKIQSFLPKLDALINKHPEYQYPYYFKVKLLLAIESNENIISTFLPFAKQKRNDFWVWQLMAEIFPQDYDIQFACYCKALSLKTPEKFLVRMKETFAIMLIERRMYNEAKTEIEKIITIREKNQWKVPPSVRLWTEQEWYKTAICKQDNSDLYSRYLKRAEEILLQDIPEEWVVVEFVNESKGVLHFIKNKQKFGFFKYIGFLESPQVGEVLKVRLEKKGEDGFYKVLTVQKAESHQKSEAIQDFKGTIKIFSPQNFGLIKNIFVEPKMVIEKQLTDGQLVKGRALLSFNKKKNEWGWKAIQIE